ncbi:Uncharacterized protein YhdP [Serratia symbiotica]|nr:Uncharacterized protein YhdP [Serratia symbiotica]
MRRIARIFLAAGQTVILIVAAMISILHLALPELNTYRPQFLAQVSRMSGVPVQVDFIQGSWQGYGPRIEMCNISVILPKANLRIKRLTLGVDIWQSLVHWRLQFRDLIFYQFQLDLNGTLGVDNYKVKPIEIGKIKKLGLHQFVNFDLRDSRVSFLTSFGERVALSIPQLTWLNSQNRHRAQGDMSLSILNHQYGVLQLRMDLVSKKRLLNSGTIYLQSQNINLKPLFSCWLFPNARLDNTDFSLQSWLKIKNNEIEKGHIFLKKGTANWGTVTKQHQLYIENVDLSIRRPQSRGWQIDVSKWQIKIDGLPGPQGELYALWIPESTPLHQSTEFRIRATNIQIERLSNLFPAFSFLSPELLERCNDVQPKGKLSVLALDIPLKQLEQTRLQAVWEDISWKSCKLLPGVDHFSGLLSGTPRGGRLTLSLNDSTMPYKGIFLTPLKIISANGTLIWRAQDKGWELESEGLDLKADALWVSGDFRYQRPENGSPWLSILAGIRLDDIVAARRYFPESLIDKPLVDYLNKAVRGGKVDNATLLYAGDPHKFPHHKTDGLFEVLVPLRHSTFEFQTGWPTLNDLAIDLHFINDRFWVQATNIKFGKIDGQNISAVIPDYLKGRLLISAELAGSATDIRDYLKQTPLYHLFGSTLDELEVGGTLRGEVDLDIPLNGKAVRAKGKLALYNNSLFLNLLGSELHQMTGTIRFDNGNLQSDTLSANWCGQPILIDLNTQEGKHNYKVNVNMQADWYLSKFPGLRQDLANKFGGSAPWKGQISLMLPHKGKMGYQIGVNADLTKISSDLPPPLLKLANEPLALRVQVSGGLNGFTLTANTGKESNFTSAWLFDKKKVRLIRASWKNTGGGVPSLPIRESLDLDLKLVDGSHWLELLEPILGKAGSLGSVILPKTMVFKTLKLFLFGQVWNNLILSANKHSTEFLVSAKGNEVDGVLQLVDNGPWRADINYLYYTPKFKNAKNPLVLGEDKGKQISWRNWPALMLRCHSCWLLGKNFGNFKAYLTHQGDREILDYELIGAGKGGMNASGHLEHSMQRVSRSLKGKLFGSTLDKTTDFFGITTPLKGGSYNILFNLYWHGRPWPPKLDTLSGTLQFKIRKGELNGIGGGRAGQLLRLVSLDAFLRKLQFDFSDTFGKGFYFDSIQSSISLKDGIMYTNNLLVDGLGADIAMSGQVNLLGNWINMQAVVAPALSTTVGVATAFFINPIFGAAMFAASQVLGPFWSKISLIRYHISGNLDQPTINQVLFNAHKDKVQ